MHEITTEINIIIIIIIVVVAIEINLVFYIAFIQIKSQNLWKILIFLSLLLAYLPKLLNK